MLQKTLPLIALLFMVTPQPGYAMPSPESNPILDNTEISPRQPEPVANNFLGDVQALFPDLNWFSSFNYGDNLFQAFNQEIYHLLVMARDWKVYGLNNTVAQLGSNRGRDKILINKFPSESGQGSLPNFQWKSTPTRNLKTQL